MEILQRYSTNFQLDIYGDGIEETNLLNEINRLGLRNVFIKGITSDMKTVYADSDILISASFFLI